RGRGRGARTRVPGEGLAPSARPPWRDVPPAFRLAIGRRAGGPGRRHAVRSGAAAGAAMRDAVGTVQSLLVLGGTSEIGAATARRLVRDRTRRVVLAARDRARAEPIAEELRAAGATEAEVVQFDATDFASHRAFV